MKLKPLMLCSTKITLIFLSFSTLSGLRTGKNLVAKNESKIKNTNSSDPMDTNVSYMDHRVAPRYKGFKISVPKPWRKDETEYKTLNQYAEIAVDPSKPANLPLPQLRSQNEKSPALSLFSAEGCGISEMQHTRIVNGKDAILGAYPWVVSILKNGESYCGGSIINERWILTAGHCFLTDQDPRGFAIRVGTIDRNQGTTYKVDKIIIHERFHLDNMFNSDIALIHVNRPIVMGSLVRPVCISMKAYEEPKATQLLVAGWGKISFENKKLPDILQQVKLSIIKIDQCAKKYKQRDNKIYYSQICTWQKGQDACQGDSGSPAIETINNIAYQVGIVSYGATCADKMPGVFTKLSYYIDWIIRTLEKEEGLTNTESENDENVGKSRTIYSRTIQKKDWQNEDEVQLTEQI